jgi:hypothetical protein
MDISEFKVKPTIIEITIDDKNLVEKYGSTITFRMYDHQKLTPYFAFFKAQREGDTEALETIIRQIVLDKDDKPVMSKGYELPVDIFAELVVKIGEQLGKSVTKNSAPTETGTQP